MASDLRLTFAAHPQGRRILARSSFMRQSAAWTFLWLHVVVLGWIGPSEEAHAASRERRWAMVVGMSSYTDGIELPELRTPLQDAKSTSAHLEMAGFKSMLHTDLTTAGFGEALASFKSTLRREIAAQEQGGEGEATVNVALFYYSGHGRQVGDEMLLYPVDARTEEAGVSLDHVIESLSTTGIDILIVVVDACRTSRSDPGGSIGVETAFQYERRDVDMFFLFSTSPGGVSLQGTSGSLFTDAFTVHMLKPGVAIEGVASLTGDAVYQGSGRTMNPWQYSSLKRPFYFVPGAEREIFWVGRAAIPVMMVGPIPLREEAESFGETGDEEESEEADDEDMGNKPEPRGLGEGRNGGSPLITAPERTGPLASSTSSQPVAAPRGSGSSPMPSEPSDPTSLTGQGSTPRQMPAAGGSGPAGPAHPRPSPMAAEGSSAPSGRTTGDPIASAEGSGTTPHAANEPGVLSSAALGGSESESDDARAVSNVVGVGSDPSSAAQKHDHGQTVATEDPLEPERAPRPRRQWWATGGRALLVAGPSLMIGGAAAISAAAFTANRIARISEEQRKLLAQEAGAGYCVVDEQLIPCEDVRTSDSSSLDAWEARWRTVPPSMYTAGSLLVAAGLGATIWGGLRWKHSRGSPDTGTRRNWVGWQIAAVGLPGLLPWGHAAALSTTIASCDGTDERVWRCLLPSGSIGIRGTLTVTGWLLNTAWWAHASAYPSRETIGGRTLPLKIAGGLLVGLGGASNIVMRGLLWFHPSLYRCNIGDEDCIERKSLAHVFSLQASRTVTGVGLALLSYGVFSRARNERQGKPLVRQAYSLRFVPGFQSITMVGYF